MFLLTASDRGALWRVIVNYDSMNAERGDGENSTLKGTGKSRVEPERWRRVFAGKPQGCVK